MKTMVRQAVPLQPLEVHSRADIHLKPMEDLTLSQSYSFLLTQAKEAVIDVTAVSGLLTQVVYK